MKVWEERYLSWFRQCETSTGIGMYTRSPGVFHRTSRRTHTRDPYGNTDHKIHLWGARSRPESVTGRDAKVWDRRHDGRLCPHVCCI
ncbi:hypothetical protein FRAHR75_670008 [Frankia sp. Hr75.2]|nr:hypothetical protein FRAHR75_670008 [Frankia sp. Hr75.2]